MPSPRDTFDFGKQGVLLAPTESRRFQRGAETLFRCVWKLAHRHGSARDYASRVEPCSRPHPAEAAAPANKSPPPSEGSAAVRWCAGVHSAPRYDVTEIGLAGGCILEDYRGQSFFKTGLEFLADNRRSRVLASGTPWP